MTLGDGLRQELPTKPRPDVGLILVTGASGYIGGRLVPDLLERGYRVRVMVRAASPEIQERWPEVEVVVADALNADSLNKALEGVHTAYYLIHSLLLGRKEFQITEERVARNFRRAAEEQKISRIIYLGGLGDVRTELSAHLASRTQVGEELSRGSVSTTILRAAIIIGSGSASYEIIEHLVRRVKFLAVPDWATTRCQPICVDDVIRYLVGVLELDETAGRSFDIGGADILTYEEMMATLAKLLGLKRHFFKSPFNGIRLFSYFASLLTPVPAAITWCLMEGITNEVICLNNDIVRLLPFKTLTYKQSVLGAMSREEQDKISTRWSDAYPPAHELAIKLYETPESVLYTREYSLVTEKPSSALFEELSRIGGKTGWFHSNWMWRLRGACDRILMGVGSSRGRRSASELRINDVIDFWRVEDLKKDERLLLRAEMQLPGRAWLEFRIEPVEGGRRLIAKAFYQPMGFWGKPYWYVFLPFHVFIFQDLIQQIEKRS